MTKKEKKEEALRIKKEIEARQPPKNWEPPTKEKLAADNWVRYKNRRSSAKEEDVWSGKYKVSKHFDNGFGRW
ncbi:MAG: hypothetical protein ABIO46_15005 [Chitinophagales bacterium]